jgi:hypothetical protein
MVGKSCIASNRAGAAVSVAGDMSQGPGTAAPSALCSDRSTRAMVMLPTGCWK